MVEPYFIVGVIGNVISLLLCACPMGAFWELANLKSSENINAIPYIAQLLCKTLWTFYGILDPNGLLIISVNSIGVVSQLIYITIYVIYVPYDKKVKTLVLMGLLNLGVPGSVIATSMFAFDESAREIFLGPFCATVTVAMYVAPFSVLVTVVKEKSVDNMPFLLSLFLLFNAVAWLMFGILLRDYFVVVPNALGVVSGSAQILIYLRYYKRTQSPAASSTEDRVGQSSLEILEAYAMENSSEVCTELKMRYRSLSLPIPTLDRQYTVGNLLRTPSGYILVP